MSQRTAIVTGGARGIGAAIVARLRVAGLAVASLDLLQPAEVRPGVLDLRCDISEAATVSDAVQKVESQLGAASVIVHCAAYQSVAPFAELDIETWQRSFQVNVDGAFHVIRSVLPGMKAGGWGRVVVLTSSSYLTPPPGMSHYVATKGALTGLVRALAAELGADGITINAVAPGLTATENARHDIPEAHFALVRSRQAVPRTGEPDDIAAAVSFLASEDASFITGQTLLVDGGESRL